MITDLTEGNIRKKLWAFSIPMLISVIFQQAYNMADSIVVGKFEGEQALAAVGASYPVTMIFMAIALGSNTGASVIISQLFGAKKMKEMKTAISTTVIACTLLSFVLTIIGRFFCAPLLQLLRTPDSIMEEAALYLNIYIYGLIFLFAYNIFNGFFNALGDSKTPLFLLIGSSLGNIVLDIIFVKDLHMGVAGVAWATFIAQGISGILAVVIFCIRMKKIETEGQVDIFSWNMLGKISRIAIPSILQQSSISIGNIVIQSVVNGYGAAVIAGYSAAIRMNVFAVSCFTTLANGLSGFVAQNIGAGKRERVFQGYKEAIPMVLLIAVPFAGLFFWGDKLILNMFISSESEAAVAAGSEFLRVTAFFYLMIAVKVMSDAVLRGAGVMGCFMLATTLDLVLRVSCSLLLSGRLGTMGIWLGWPIGWSSMAVLSGMLAYYKVFRVNMKEKIPAAYKSGELHERLI